MPGSGKSTIGRSLSDYLKFDFYDTDEQIELESQSKINDIFNQEGEGHFRKLERSIFKKLILKKRIVVSTGGGIILKNKDLLKQTFNIYLKCDLETLIKRTSRNKNRPLLKNNVEKNIKILFNNRKEIYNESSDFTINATSNTQKTIKTILEHLK
jgi:shikimate kinase